MFIICEQPASLDLAWLVDEGPFKDRLGMDAHAIAASTHDACKAVTWALNNRKYVDLKGQALSDMLDLLIATNQPTANAMFPGSGPMTTTKKSIIINTLPTAFERHKG